MNATLLLLAPALLGQVSLPTGIGGRTGVPPIVVTSPQGGSLPQTRSFDLGSGLKTSIPDIRTPRLDIPSNNLGGAASPGSRSASDSSSSSSSGPGPVTASRDEEITTSVATPSGMFPPPPQDIHEAPPDGGDDDDDEEKSPPSGFEWGKTLALIIVGALFLYGLTRP